MLKNKILIIGQTPPPYGGQIIHIGKIVSILESNKIEHRLLRMNFSEDMDETGKLSFLKIYKLLMLVLKLLNMLAFYRPDYVYYPPSGCEKVPIYRDFIMLFFVRLFNFKTIFHFHAGGISDLYPQLNFIFKKVFKFIFSKPTYSICMSESGVKDPQFLKCSEIVVIPYGVDDVKLNVDILTSKDVNKFQVLFVGVCRETKGIIDFVKVVEKANSLNTKIVGRIIGKVFSHIEDQAIKEGIKKGIIKYEGVKIGKDKNAVFCECDVFLFPTFFEHENFPTVNLEAFSSGLPVVSTQWRGVVNQIKNKYNGFIHEIHDIDGMANSIVEISNDPILHSLLSKNARHDYLNLYSDELFEQNILIFFKSLK
ncbi:glycosyltransferase family 4 protein [Pedobacter immunditicola]|uniref:glycosyltransferase family 4 protein n=1 Tax=Pedobacter immunditicola TaxID=3133440 RepID=UPI003097C1C6